MKINKKSIVTTAFAVVLLATPMAFANFVIGGNSATTGYGYGYGDCYNDTGNNGYRSPCVGYAGATSYGYGYGARAGAGSTSGGSSSGSSVVLSGTSATSYNYVSGTGVNGTCSPNFTTYTRQGSRGAEVTKLQSFLNKLGANLPVTGYFGSLTKAAVKNFQTKYGFAATYGPAYVSGNQLKMTTDKLNEIYCNTK